MKFKLELFWKELLLFGLTLALGIFAAGNLFEKGPVLIQQGEFQLKDFITLAIFIIVLLLLRRKKKALGFIYKAFLILIIISGSQIIFGSFLSFPWEAILTLVVLTAFLFYRNVFTHNIAIIIGIAGVGAVIGLGITPKIGVFLLVLLSFYDVIAVYKTKHMVQLARGMVESGAIFGFVIPSSVSGFFSHRDEAMSKIDSERDGFMILGSGDIGLPLIMVCSLVPISFSSAVVVAIFSVIGLFITHFLFVNQGQRKPMAALPPIATMTIIGYLITVVIK